MEKILIVEDDLIIANELKILLENANYEAIILNDFENSLKEIKKINANLILLDINIPKMNGELLLKEIRKESDVAVIMLTSKNSEIDEVLSMSYGADDYITKPYNPTILLLRIGAILKRINKSVDIFRYKDLDIFLKKGIIKKGNIEINLTKNEMIIFNLLLSSRGEFVTRDAIMTELWNNDEFINENALTVNISRLRSKLKEISLEDLILTKKNLGYMLI